MTESPDTSSMEHKKRKNTESVPADGYVCKLCGVSGHWIQQCPNERQEKKRRRHNKHKNSSHHEYQQGVDPSPEDIALAKTMQQLKPPPCTCGQPSRIKKVKKSHVNPNSRANGSYFFFCAKKKNDPTKCQFAQLAEEQPQQSTAATHKTDKDKSRANFFAKKRKGMNDVKK